MINYLVNSTLCSALLLTAYHLLLKNKTTYIFNRFYLLLAMPFSLSVPLFVVTQTAMVPGPVNIVQQGGPQAYSIIPPDVQTDATHAVQVYHPQTTINYLPYILLGIYAIVALLFLYRFVRNLIAIRRQLPNSEPIIYGNARLILTEEKLIPHTFLKNIFINKDEYRADLLEPDVLKHELTHARQLHSIDVIFIELLQAIYWFNPFIFLYKTAIQLNHEFIADAAVVNNSGDITTYQYLLLDKVTGLHASGLTSQFNYSVTKKRLIMMTKNTSTGMAMVARLSIIPVMAAAFMLFCTKTHAQQSSTPARAKPQAVTSTKTPANAKQGKSKVIPHLVRFSDYPYTKDGVSDDKITEYMAITAKYEEGPDREVLHPSKITAEDEQKMEPIFRQMSMAQQDQQTITFFYPPDPLPRCKPTQEQIDTWKDPKFCGVWIDGKKSKNTDLENYTPADFGNFFVSRLLGAARKHATYKYQVDLMTNDYYKKYRADAIANRHKPRMACRMLNRRVNKG